MTMKKNFKGVKDLKDSENTVPPMTDEQIREAKKNEIENAQRILQGYEADLQKRKHECFQEIAAICTKFGFQLSCEVSKPEVTVHLLPIQ